MGNSQSAPNPRKGEPKRSRSHSSPSKKASRKINNRLSKPKTGGETPNPIPLPRSLSRRNSKSSIQQTCLPDPPARLNSIDGGTVPHPSGLARTGSIDLGRQNSLTGPGWSRQPSARPSRETLNGNGNPSQQLGSVWLERRRSLIRDPPTISTSPPPVAMSPPRTRPMTAPAAEMTIDVSPLLEPEDLPPPTASSTASFHSALQSPTRIQHSPSPTKFLNGQNGDGSGSSLHQSPQHQNMGYTSEPPYQVPVRRRSLLQAAAPGTATRPKVVREPEPELELDMMRAEDEYLFVPPSRLLAINPDGVRPETPQDQGALGVFRRGSLYVTNGAPSPIPSSPSLRAASGGSQRPRDSSLLSLPPVSPADVPDQAEEPTTATPRTPTKSDKFAIPRKPIGSLPSSPQSAKKPVILVETASPPARHSLRLVPPSPTDDEKSASLDDSLQPPSQDGDEVSIDEDPHRRHLFHYNIRNKQFMNGQYQPSPSSDYTEESSSAGASAKPGLYRSPFSYEGSKLMHATNPYAIDVEGGERYSVAIEPTKGFMGLDTPGLDEIKPKPLVIRKSPTLTVQPPLEANTQGNVSECISAVSSAATEEKPTSSSDSSDLSVQSQAKQSSVDSGYSSAGSSILPPPKSWKRAVNRQSAPEQLAEVFNNRYPEMRPATSHGPLEPTVSSPAPVIPHASAKDGQPPMMVEPPLSPPPRAPRKEVQRPTTAPAQKTESKAKTDEEAPPKKPKKKRRLSFKRLSFKSEKKAEPTPPVEVEAPRAPEETSKPTILMPTPIRGIAKEPDQTQYQLQPQPERRQSLTSSIRSGLQSIGYAPEAASVPTSPIESSPHHEPMALTSSTPTRAILALRSSESVTYTGAAYYQRFSTPSPGPGSIPNMVVQNTPPHHTPPHRPSPQPTPPQHVPIPERHPSLPKHATPPSSYKPPPHRFPVEDNNNNNMNIPPSPQNMTSNNTPPNNSNNLPPVNRPIRPTVDTTPIRRRPLGNTAIKSSPQSPAYPPFSPTTPTATRPSSRANSLTSTHYSYNPQSGFYTPNDTRRGGQQGRFPALPSSSQPHSPAYNGVLPFATGTPLRRQRSGSSGSVGPGGYPHLGHDFMTDRAMLGLDFRDVPVRRANDLVTSYGSTNAGFQQHRRRPSMEYDVYRGAGGGVVNVGGGGGGDGGYAEQEERKKESFWRKATSVGRGRSKSQVRGSELVGY
ncbi:hypothetical protein ABW21_db0201916 [Orbilia brochopaga]|nr:hypothetical protein ABW21_db0201916 [Drechslerella brochopaga]